MDKCKVLHCHGTLLPFAYPRPPLLFWLNLQPFLGINFLLPKIGYVQGLNNSAMNFGMAVVSKFYILFSACLSINSGLLLLLLHVVGSLGVWHIG